MTDFLLLDQLGRMIREVKRPRLMYRKGIVAEGFFRPYMSWSDHTRAEMMRNPDEITAVTVRFSSMTGDRGTPDTARNIKGMAVKFRGRDGCLDLICQSLPVFFINDEGKFPYLKDAMSRRSCFDRYDKERLWRFAAENPESLNCIIRLFSCQGLCESFVDVKWYSVNTYVWENAEGKRILIRYKWSPVLRKGEIKTCMTGRIRAEFMAGFDPDRCEEDLESRIREGRFPCFELQVQMRSWEDGRDAVRRTLCWDEKQFPPVPAGVMKLTKAGNECMESEDSISFIPGNTFDGMYIYGDEFSRIMEHAQRTGAAQRGGSL